MHMPARVRRTMITTLMCTFVAAMVVSPAALAQNRGNSGLPSGPRNPIAKLQREISALTQQVAAVTQLGKDVSTLGQQVAALQQQMTAWVALQQQVNTLSTRIKTLDNEINGLSAQLAALGASNTASNTLGVFDANGKKIGNVVGVQDSVPWVVLTAAGQQFALQVSPNQLLTGGFLWYTGANCSGAVYLSDYAAFINGPTVLSVAAVQEPGGVVYTAAANAPLQSVNVGSVLQQDGTCFDFGGSFSQNVSPATPVMTLDANFKRPYSVHE